jgi:hypothetical protein
VNAENLKTAKKALTHSWNAEKLALQDRKSVEMIRDRALKHGVGDLVVLCDHDLASRPSPQKKRASSKTLHHSVSDAVAGYHFVCERGRGVTEIGDGQFRSGSWVVAEANVRKSIERGAYLALHEAKNETSYRQGTIVDYRRSPRDMVQESETGVPPQIDEGIEFLVQETGQSYVWVGGGAGEKGYYWADQASANDIDAAPGEQNP